MMTLKYAIVKKMMVMMMKVVVSTIFVHIIVSYLNIAEFEFECSDNEEECKQ